MAESTAEIVICGAGIAGIAAAYHLAVKQGMRDIVLVGRRDDGLGIYSYRYLWSDAVYVGVMAQEVALVHPDAVVRGVLDDYLRVDYSRLGTRLMTPSEWEAKS